MQRDWHACIAPSHRTCYLLECRSPLTPIELEHMKNTITEVALTGTVEEIYCSISGINKRGPAQPRPGWEPGGHYRQNYQKPQFPMNSLQWLLATCVTKRLLQTWGIQLNRRSDQTLPEHGTCKMEWQNDKIHINHNSFYLALSIRLNNNLCPFIFSCHHSRNYTSTTFNRFIWISVSTTLGNRVSNCVTL